MTPPVNSQGAGGAPSYYSNQKISGAGGAPSYEASYNFGADGASGSSAVSGSVDAYVHPKESNFIEDFFSGVFSAFKYLLSGPVGCTPYKSPRPPEIAKRKVCSDHYLDFITFELDSRECINFPDARASVGEQLRFILGDDNDPRPEKEGWPAGTRLLIEDESVATPLEEKALVITRAMEGNWGFSVTAFDDKGQVIAHQETTNANEEFCKGMGVPFQPIFVDGNQVMFFELKPEHKGRVLNFKIVDVENNLLARGRINVK